MDRITTIPKLTYSEAERVGKRLCTRWAALTGHKPQILKEEVWADVVQAVMRWAGDVMNQPPQPPEKDQEQ